MQVQKEVHVRGYQQDGNMWRDLSFPQMMTHSAAISVDTSYDYVNGRYTSVSLIIVNGTPPGDFLRADPYSAVEYMDILHVYEAGYFFWMSHLAHNQVGGMRKP